MNRNPLPHIQAQMEEFMTGIYDRIHDMVPERLTTSNSIAYTAKWDTPRTYVDAALHNIKTFTS